MLLPDGKEYQYGTSFETTESDVAVVGNIFPRGQSLDIKNAATTGCMGVVTLMTPKITVPAGKVAELDFVFSRNVSKKMVTGCAAYLNGSAIGQINLNYGKFYFFGEHTSGFYFDSPNTCRREYTGSFLTRET